MSYLQLKMVGREFYDSEARVNVSEWKMELWPGYKTSIRQHEKSILMSAEVTHKIMRNENVLSVLDECLRMDQTNYKQLFKDRIIGTVVLTGYNNRTYRIDDIDWDKSPSSTFSKQDGTQITYLQYYKERYQLDIRQKNQPMLISRARAREIRAGMPENLDLVPELCRLTGLTDQQRSNFQLMKALAEHTRVGPEKRIEKLLAFANRLKNQPRAMEELKMWDMQLANRLVEFNARVLPTEVLIGGLNRQIPAGERVDWTSALRSNPMINMADLSNWVVIVPSKMARSANSFIEMCLKAAGGMSWRIARPRFVEINDDRPHTYSQQLQQLFHQGKPQLLMCVVPNNKADRYSFIKKKCSVENAVPSQVILARNLESKGAMSIATKVVIQLNCKLGGAPWIVNIPVQHMMIIGYDVCHDPKDKRKSFGATVCSLDKGVSRHFSQVSAHTAGEELSNDFALSIVKGCKAYRQIHNVFPSRLIVYRDGVGEGQINYVYEHEVQMIIKMLQDHIYKDQELKLTFIIVTKRIQMRIFENGRNPPPGTVVDDVITCPER